MALIPSTACQGEYYSYQPILQVRKERPNEVEGFAGELQKGASWVSRAHTPTMNPSVSEFFQAICVHWFNFTFLSMNTLYRNSFKRCEFSFLTPLNNTFTLPLIRFLIQRCIVNVSYLICIATVEVTPKIRFEAGFKNNYIGRESHSSKTLDSWLNLTFLHSNSYLDQTMFCLNPYKQPPHGHYPPNLSGQNSKHSLLRLLSLRYINYI